MYAIKPDSYCVTDQSWVGVSKFMHVYLTLTPTFVSKMLTLKTHNPENWINFETPSLFQNLLKLFKTTNTMLFIIKLHFYWLFSPSGASTQKSTVCLESREVLSLSLPRLQIKRKAVKSQLYFILQSFSRHH